MIILTENSAQLLEKIVNERTGKPLQQVLEQNFPRYESPELKQKKAEVLKYRLPKPSTTPWYSPQRIIRYFR
jgi:hypothetical protein